MNTRICKRSAALLGVMFALSVWTGWTLAGDKPTVIRDVVYAERSSGPLKADVHLPTGDGPFPAVLVVHGGAWRSGDKMQLAFIANKLAQEGFVAVAIGYRLAPEHKFPAQIEDCKSAVRWMRQNASQYKIDPEWIAGWGYSAGAHLVSLLGTTDTSANLEGSDVTPDSPSTRLQAVVAGGTPCDFRPIPEDNDGLAFWLGATRKEKPEIYEIASPAFYITGDDPPVFLYHGDADELVPLENAQQMSDALHKAGVECELFVIEKAKHVPAALNGKAMMAGVTFLLNHRPKSGAGN